MLKNLLLQKPRIHTMVLKKKLKFDIANFKKFQDKITYIVVDKPPPNILSLKKMSLSMLEVKN